MPKKKTTTRNKFEERIFEQLKKAGTKPKYETEKIPYVIEGNYIPDFIIETLDGKIYLETKGHFRPEAKRKMVAVKKMHPNLDIRLVFYRADKKNIRWAEKNGFKYCFYALPEDWLNEMA